jgi:predicted metal-binding protein
VSSVKILEPKFTSEIVSQPKIIPETISEQKSGFLEKEAYTPTCKVETRQTEAFPSFSSQKKQEKPISQEFSMRKEFLFRYIKPNGPCELCGQRAVEVLIKTPQGSFARCMECWQKLREQFKNIHWIEEREEA